MIENGNINMVAKRRGTENITKTGNSGWIESCVVHIRGHLLSRELVLCDGDGVK